VFLNVNRKVDVSEPESLGGASERFASSLGEPTKPLAPHLFFYRPRSRTKSKFQMRSQLPFAPAAIGNMRRHAGPRAQGSGSAISIDLIASFVLK
jgi:hypothetical protein